MKRIIMVAVMAVIMAVCFAQGQTADVAGQAVEQTVEKTGFFASIDWSDVLNIALGVIGFAFAVGFAFAQKKIRQAGELLIKFADAVEDKKIDANERTDLAAAAKQLFSKG